MNELPRAMRLWSLALLSLGCRGLELPPRQAGAPEVVAREPARAPEPAQDPLETIARFEEARSDGGGLLELLLVRGEPRVRERAAEALGRMPAGSGGAEVQDALAGALDDPEPAVRAAAAFGIGLRGAPAGAGALLAHAADPDPTVRARVVEAASRVDDPRMVALVLAALEDPEPSVRVEAAVAPHRWTGERAKAGGDATRVDAALVALARPAATDERQPVEVLRAALFALARRKSEVARELFEESLGDADAHVRSYACQGLAQIGSETSLAGLRRALGDPEWRVACEAALALGRHARPESVDALASALAHPSAHVRRTACEALGGFGVERRGAFAALARAAEDASPNVRSAALVARTRLDPQAALAGIEEARAHPDPLIRAGAAAALAHVRPPRAEGAPPATSEPAEALASAAREIAIPGLTALSKDPNLRVAGIAVEGLGEHAGEPAARARLVELLGGPDNGLRLAAVEALRKSPREADLVPLAASYASARGEISPELSFTILAAAAEIGGVRARELLEQGLDHPDAYVRRKARELLASKFPSRALPAARNGRVPAPLAPLRTWSSRPRVEIVTSRGAMLFELLPDETPRHVESFLALAARDHYDGLAFHRVVPDFVIQGGDPRGDGNGGSAANGGSLAAEFTPRKFVRGALGMPRNEDPDSGGAQIFVTHRETPHLDGRYTLFGLLREGFDVLDAIEVGDTIRDVRVVDGSD